MFFQKFGVRPSEGYGTTELSPVAAVNIPDHRTADVHQKGTKLGTVGRPLPGVTAKVVNPETWQDLGIGKEGLLLIKGPNVMTGYLGHPEKTAEMIKDGWYNTGDYGRIDEEGFVEITGRQSRFSKIGGEMVPHLNVEEAVNAELGAADGELLAVVTAVPDRVKGERLIVFHLPTKQEPRELVRRLGQRGLPNLWVPAADSFAEIGELPMLGSGKLDLRRLQEMALERFAEAHSS